MEYFLFESVIVQFQALDLNDERLQLFAIHRGVVIVMGLIRVEMVLVSADLMQSHFKFVYFL